MPNYTTVLNLQSLAFPNISNPIRVDVATQENPTAIVVSELDTKPGHPERIWSFPGLPRTNYVVEMNEVDAGGNKLNRLAYFDVVPNNLDTLTIRMDEQLKPGVTPGFNVGDKLVYFDGRDVAVNPSDYALQGFYQIDTSGWWQTFKGTPINGDKTTVHFLVNGLNQYSNVIHTGTLTLQDYLIEIANDVMSIDPRVVATVLDIGGYWGISFTTGGGNTTSGDVTIVNTSASTIKSPDFRGWNINPERRNQPGFMLRGEEYNWDETTGLFELLITGDIFLLYEPYNFRFDNKASPAGGSVGPEVTVKGFQNKLVTANYTIPKEEVGFNFIVEPSGGYMELTIPAAVDVVEGIVTKISIYKSSLTCVKIIGTVINPFAQNIFLLPGESIELYCFVRSVGNNEWRFNNAVGNFGMVGTIVYADKAPLNSIQGTGVSCDILNHARLWQWVNQLPANQKVTFSNWANNQTFFSLNSGNEFKAPNRVGLYPKIASTSEIAGTKLNQQMMKHKHFSPSGSGPSTQSPFGAGNVFGKYSWKDQDSDNQFWMTNDGSEIPGMTALNSAGLFGDEIRPNSFLINQYILL